MFENKIKKIGSELEDNTKLQFLDLSCNQIEECDLSLLPKSIVIFNIESNPINLMEEDAKLHLPNLLQFNKREFINEEFVAEEELPFDRKTLTRLRSSQSGRDILRQSISKDSTASSDTEDEIIPVTKVSKMSLADLEKVNNEVVENYKKSLFEEMERIKTEFKEKKDKVINGIKERKLANSQDDVTSTSSSSTASTPRDD